MSETLRCRNIATFGLAGLLATTSIPSGALRAQGLAAGDGAPNPAACAEFGYRLAGHAPVAIPAPRPSPPPPVITPIPAGEAVVEEIISTGTIIRGAAEDSAISVEVMGRETLSLAESAKGEDRDGLRAEFIGLVRAAKEVGQRRAGL